MKFTAKILLLAASVTLLSACNDSDDDSTNPSTSQDHVYPEFKPTLLDYTPGKLLSAGSSDASTAVSIDGEYIIVADDESNALRVYPKNGGDAVAEWDFSTQGPQLKKELDIEASALLKDNRAYFIGSHGNKKDGGDAADRSHLFAVKISGKGAQTQFEYQGIYSNLEKDLVDWDQNNLHQKGKDHFGFKVSAAAGVAPENLNGFAIEGMTASHDEKQLLLGFRAPVTDQGQREKALIIPLINYQQLIQKRDSKALFAAPIELDLAGRGIRSMAKTKNGQYLIVAGPAAGNQNALDNAFGLYLWDGKSSTPQLLNNRIENLRSQSKGSIETIVETHDLGDKIQLLLDNGDSIWEGQTAVSKDLEPHQQKFQGAIFNIGSAFKDTVAPQIITAIPENNLQGVNLDSPIQLLLNEGIKSQVGQFDLYENNQFIQSFNAQNNNLKINFNQVELQPTQPFKINTEYKVVMSQGLQDHNKNLMPTQTITQFKTAGQPTELALGDLYFMATNAEAPDAIAFMLMKDINGGTEIYFSDRDYSAEKTSFWDRKKDQAATNEGVFRWTADLNLKAGSIITIQTDTPTSPIANIGRVLGSPSGIGKEETIFAMSKTKVNDLKDGSAGLITDTGTFLAAITVGSDKDNDIPESIRAYSLKFMPSIAEQTNAIYNVKNCGLERQNLTALKLKLMDKNCWSVSYKSQGASGFPIKDNSLFANAVVH
ncbi:Ig-like domain-containing protein [Acinetobacter rudis]|uniref:Ig-like domain-containing protein n=1 Tax=Acinetobacter rudis TaxID=632955 RepID=UPI003341324E